MRASRANQIKMPRLTAPAVPRCRPMRPRRDSRDPFTRSMHAGRGRKAYLRHDASKNRDARLSGNWVVLFRQSAAYFFSLSLLCTARERSPAPHTQTMATPPIKYAFVARGADVLAELPGVPPGDAARHKAVGQSCLDRCPPGGEAAR